MKTAKNQNRPAGKSLNKTAAPAPKVSIKSILVPVDFSEPSTKALLYATSLAEQFGAKLTLLFVAEPVGMPDFARSFPLVMENEELIAACKMRLSKLAKKTVKNPVLLEKTLVREGRAYVEITDAARTLKSDLIVIATHGYSGISRAILGSVTERVVRHAPCPVLVVREHEHEFVKP